MEHLHSIEIGNSQFFDLIFFFNQGFMISSFVMGCVANFNEFCTVFLNQFIINYDQCYMNKG